MGQRAVDRGTPSATTGDPWTLDLRGLGIRLLAYARRRAGTRGWRLGAGALAAGQGVEDIVQDAIASLVTTPRQWNPQQEPDPWRHLMSFVNSRLSTLRRSADNRQVEVTFDAERSGLRAALGLEETPETELLAREELAWRARVRDRLLERIIEDVELVALYDCIITAEIDKPARIAERLGVSVQEVYNRFKRLRRHCAVVLREQREALAIEEVADGS